MNRVTFLDQSGYIVTTDDVIMVFDYYRDPSHALKHTLDNNPDKPVVFFVSHYRKEHFDKSIFELAQNHRRTYVMSNDVYPQNVPDSLAVAGMSKGDVLEDLPGGLTVKAYESTGKGICYYVTAKSGEKIFHAGTLNYGEDETSKKDGHKSGEPFNVLLNRIASEVSSVDIAFFPVDASLGKDYAEGAREFLNAISVKDFFPLIISGEYRQACDFATYAPERTTCHCIHTPGESIDLS